MKVVKVLGLVFLAVYLIIVGLSGFLGATIIPLTYVHLIAAVAGVLILISLYRFCCHDDSCRCDRCDKVDKK